MTGRRVPVATLLLIATNLVAAFLVTLQPELLEQVQFNPARPSVTGALLSLFFHLNLFHLLGNLVFLAAVGAAVELATGALRFLAVCLSGGLMGILAHWLAMRDVSEPTPLLGASGCIAACVGYYALRYLPLKVPLAPKVPVSLTAVIALWVALQVLGAVVRIGDTELAVSFWSHLGGFLGGVILSFIFRAPDFRQLEFKNEVLQRMNERGPAATLAAAREILSKLPDDLNALTSAADAAEAIGEHVVERQMRERLLKLSADDQEAAFQYRRLRELGKLEGPMERRKAAARFATVDPTLTRELLESAIQDDPVAAPEILLDLATLLRETDPPASEKALDVLMAEHGMTQAAETVRQRGWR